LLALFYLLSYLRTTCDFQYRYLDLRLIMLRRNSSELASAAEGSGQLHGLIISGEESVLESLLDYHRNILHPIDGRSNHYYSWAKRPRCQIHLHPSLRLWMEYSLADLDKERKENRIEVLGRSFALYNAIEELLDLGRISGGDVIVVFHRRRSRRSYARRKRTPRPERKHFLLSRGLTAWTHCSGVSPLPMQ